tara:strand:- start:15 stop:194 length:180 start_codon:yes stop_codon:yes gene_type:complete
MQMTEFEIKRLTKRVADLEKNQKKLLEITGGLLKQLQTTQEALFELGEIVKKNTGKDHP